MGTITLENYLLVSTKTNHIPNLWPNFPLLVVYQRGMYADNHQKTTVWMFRGASFITVEMKNKKQKTTHCPSIVHGSINYGIFT